AEPLEHPFKGPVRAGDETVEGHDHLENHSSVAHVGRDLPARANSSPACGKRSGNVEIAQRLSVTRKPVEEHREIPTPKARQPRGLRAGSGMPPPVRSSLHASVAR